MTQTKEEKVISFTKELVKNFKPINLDTNQGTLGQLADKTRHALKFYNEIKKDVFTFIEILTINETTDLTKKELENKANFILSDFIFKETSSF